MISSIKKFLNIDDLTPVKYTKLSDAKHINVTYKLEYNDKFYAVRICDKEYYSFLKEVSYIFKNISPTVLYTDDEECIIINEWINNKQGYTVEDVVNNIKEMQKIKEIPTNKFYNDILYTNYEWLEEESFKNYHKRWYSLYFKINDYLKKNLEIGVCHNDFHNENMIYSGEKLNVIDLELVSYNHCYTDLAQQSSYFDKEQLLKEYYTGDEYINENTHILYDLAVIEYFLYYSFMIRRLNNFTNFYEIGLDIKRFKEFDQTGLNLLDDRYNFIASLVMGFEAEELIKEFNTKYSNFFTFE
jgi:tRNA A-37 threonylcarbamoyl transferase component Bud32